MVEGGAAESPPLDCALPLGDAPTHRGHSCFQNARLSGTRPPGTRPPGTRPTSPRTRPLAGAHTLKTRPPPPVLAPALPFQGAAGGERAVGRTGAAGGEERPKEREGVGARPGVRLEAGSGRPRAGKVPGAGVLCGSEGRKDWRGGCAGVAPAGGEVGPRRGGEPCVLEQGGATRVKRLIPESLLAPGPPGYLSGGFPVPLHPSAPKRDGAWAGTARWCAPQSSGPGPCPVTSGKPQRTKSGPGE